MPPDPRRSTRHRLAPTLGLPALVLLAACDTTEPSAYTIDPAALESHVQEAVAAFECGYSTFAWLALGHDGVLQSVAGVAATAHVYRATPASGACDTSNLSRTWFDPIMSARAELSNADGTGLYDLMQTEPASSEIDRLSAIAAIYVAASLAHFGEFLCETTLDGGDLMTPDEVLALAEGWITDRALAHIVAHGDFALSGGSATSARHMARALRARIRWARGDLQGAASDAETIPQGFTAWVTRDAGDTRRNRPYVSATEIAFSSMLGVNVWWDPTSRQPNPATGTTWPDPIPFTGYRFLGILPDGRAVDDSGYAVRWAEEARDVTGQPVPLGNGAVADTRVPSMIVSISGPEPHEVPTRYASEADDIPLVSWQEMWLVRAEHEGGQAAIDLVNDLRADAGLPNVTYIDGGTATAEQIRYMLLEERRRALFSEGGRFWATKLRNLDVLWFPRAQGQTPWQGYPLEGGVRLALPEDEYTTNPFLLARGGLSARGTGCDPAEAPVIP